MRGRGIVETAQSHIRKGLLIKQILGNSQVIENSKVEIPKVKLKLDEVNNPVSIKGHLLKSLLITK